MSLILPVYNVEKYLEDCLESLLCQDIEESDYEIICVIDGSTDNSKKILEAYLQYHKNIKIFEQHNQGVCVARNVGLNNAIGKYIWFIDPDDIIFSNCLKTIYETMEQFEADIFEFDYITCGEKYHFYPREAEITINGRNKDGASGAVWLAVYKRAYLLENGISFNIKLNYGEDYLWAFQTKYRKHSSIFTRAPLYIYRKRQGSAMNSLNLEKNKKHMQDMIELYKIYNQEIVRCKEDSMGKDVFDNIKKRQQLCCEAALICLMKLRLSFKETQEQLLKWEKEGIYPYKLMLWNIFGKNTIHPFKLRMITFLFPVKKYFLLICYIYQKIRR